jgi:hypothetical protein
MSKVLAIVAVAALAICGSNSAFAAGDHGGGGHGGGSHFGGDHGGGGHFGGGHGGGFGGGGFVGPGIGFDSSPSYYDYGYGSDAGCYQVQRVWTGRRWRMRQVQVC